MKIAVNTRFLIKNKLEGIGWFTYETMKRITQGHPEHQFLFLFDRPYDPEFIFSGNITPVEVFPQARHPFLWFTWFEVSLPLIFADRKPDLFLSPDGFLCLSTKIPSIPVIHDLNFEHIGEGIPWVVQKYYKEYMPRFAKKASRIITVSEFSKSDISCTYQIDPTKIDVAYNGANEMFSPITQEEKEQVKQKYSQGCEYFIYVGALNPRKNVARLLAAFDQFKKENGTTIKLLLVGGKMFKTSQIEDVFDHMQFKDDVHFLGRREPDELRGIMGAAMALTFVPCFEGFGIPIVEAMKSHTPVITSNVTSMPEVGGDAVILADPYSVESIAAAMKTIASDELLRQQLIQRGIARASQFSWDKTAATVWNSIEKTRT